MNKTLKAAIWGFLFGTVGLFILSALALMLPFFEAIGNVLTAPIKMISARFAGSEGSNGEVFLLTLLNGILYAIIFAVVRKLYGLRK